MSLVLSRKADEKILIDLSQLATLSPARLRPILQSPIVVTTAQIRGDKVRLAFDCGKEIIIRRKEVQESIDQEGLKKP